MNKKVLYILISLFVIILSLGAYLNVKYFQNNQNVVPSTINPSLQLSVSPSPSAANLTALPTSSPIPSSYLIKNFPFEPQAPFGVWDETHDEACEEATLALVYYFLSDKNISAEIMEDQIQKMVAWEIENFGSHKDLTIEEVSKMAREFYFFDNLKIQNNLTIDDIKREIAQNHPVIIPTAGRLLGNPYFRQPGPIYHMMVVIGYEGNIMIVQDVGTKRGDHYRYSEKVLFNAIHDWAGTPENIETGKKTMLVFE